MRWNGHTLQMKSLIAEPIWALNRIYHIPCIDLLFVKLNSLYFRIRSLGQSLYDPSFPSKRMHRKH